MTKGSDLLVTALENEGVERIFGVPGEENLDVVESLRTSSDRARADPPRAVGSLHGGDARPADRPARRLPGDARARARSTSSPARPTPISARCRWS